MLSEPSNLDTARKLLAEFERQMSEPGCIVHLSDALNLLSDIADADGELGGICQKLTTTYAEKTIVEVVPLLTAGEHIYEEKLDHWIEILSEFGRCNFDLPPHVVDTRTKLIVKKLLIQFKLLPSSEQKRFLEEIQNNRE